MPTPPSWRSRCAQHLRQCIQQWLHRRNHGRRTGHHGKRGDHAGPGAPANRPPGAIQADPDQLADHHGARAAIPATARRDRPLDQRRAQVFVESLIREVNADKAAEFGIQWQGALGKAGDKRTSGLLGTNFSIGGQNIISLATGRVSGTAPADRGQHRDCAATPTASTYWGSWRFLEAGDGNILSTPNLLTLDNEEAKIVIGQNVPS